MTICCRRDSPDASDPTQRAGKFGEGGCDLPNVTAESFVREAIRQSPDMIFWLGDNPAHDMHEQKKETQLDNFRFLARKFASGGYSGKIYAVLGNHDSYPPGQFDPQSGAHRWVTKGFADELRRWLDPQGMMTPVC